MLYLHVQRNYARVHMEGEDSSEAHGKCEARDDVRIHILIAEEQD